MTELLIKTVACTRFGKGRRNTKGLWAIASSSPSPAIYSIPGFPCDISSLKNKIKQNKTSPTPKTQTNSPPPSRLILGRCLGAPFALNWIVALFHGHGGSSRDPHTRSLDQVLALCKYTSKRCVGSKSLPWCGDAKEVLRNTFFFGFRALFVLMMATDVASI